MSIEDHIEHSPASISKLAPYSALILSIVLVVLFLIRFYILQRFLLEKLYGSQYTDLDDANRRSFLNHHISGATKFAILLLAVYPFGAVAFGTANFHTPYVHGSIVKMGDLLLIAAQMLSGMFIFELVYRFKISPVSVAHHIGSIMVAQAAITISIEGERVSSIEFVLCTVWGKQATSSISNFVLTSRVANLSHNRCIRYRRRIHSSCRFDFVPCLSHLTPFPCKFVQGRLSYHIHSYNFRNNPCHVSVRRSVGSMASFF